MPRRTLKTGEVVGKWTVLELRKGSRKAPAKDLCRCHCGTVREVFRGSLLSGQSYSCGCVPSETSHRTKARKTPDEWAAYNRARNEKRKAQGENMRSRYKMSDEEYRAKRYQWSKAYLRSHPERVQASKRRWAENNPDKMREACRRWYWNNTSRARLLAKLHGGTRHKKYREGSLTKEQWLETCEIFGNVCAYCLGPANSMDHIEPISTGGKHEQDNTVPCCSHCNSSKNDKSLLLWLLTSKIAQQAIKS